MTDEKKPPQEVASETICAGVDVMSDRLVVGIYAFGPETRRLAELTLWCNPDRDASWQQLHALLCSYSGLQLVAVDSGGLHTQQVYRFAHASSQEGAGAAHKVFAVKGQSIRGVPPGMHSQLVQVGHQGRLLPDKIELLLIDMQTNTAKNDLLSLATAVYLWQFASTPTSLFMHLKPPSYK